jgi:chemotaxis signal transduction protein
VSFDPGRLVDTARDLGRAFDAGFAAEPRTQRPVLEDLLAIAIDGQPYAVPLSEVAGVFKDRRVTALPSSAPGFLGVAGIRGSIVAVYDLPALLGHSPAASRRWLLLAKAAEPVGFVFDTFEGQLSVSPQQVVASRSDGAPRHVSRAVSDGDRLRYVVDLASVVEAVSSRARPGPPPKER